MYDFYKDRHIVLTGASGFLGKCLLSRFARLGARVTAVSSLSLDELSGACGCDFSGFAVEAIKRDDRKSTRRSLYGADCLVNAAFPRSNDGQQLASGIEYTDWLFRAANSEGVSAVINISSQSVYSQYRSAPARESDQVCLETPYAVAKYATELMLSSSCADVPCTSIRLASLIGPGFDQRVINKMAKNAIKSGIIQINEIGSEYGYLDYLDAVDAIVALIASGKSNLKAFYNLGPERAYTLTEMAYEIFDVLGKQAKVLNTNKYKGEKINSSLNSDLFMYEFHWRPQISLRGSIEAICRRK